MSSVVDLASLATRLRGLPKGDWMGRVTKVVGLVVESSGPDCSVGEQMLIHSADATGRPRLVHAEVVGFSGKLALAMPYGALKRLEIARALAQEEARLPPDLDYRSVRGLSTEVQQPQLGLL